MSYVNIMVHGVWGTKNRASYLPTDLKKEVCNHIKQNAKAKGVYIDTINGHEDHLHSLMNLKPDLSISKQMQLIKGESSHWINQNQFLKSHFGWADEYFAESVSPDHVENLRYYINNQEAHHRKVSFQDEFQNLLRKFGFLNT